MGGTEHLSLRNRWEVAARSDGLLPEPIVALRVGPYQRIGWFVHAASGRTLLVSRDLASGAGSIRPALDHPRRSVDQDLATSDGDAVYDLEIGVDDDRYLRVIAGRAALGEDHVILTSDDLSDPVPVRQQVWLTAIGTRAAIVVSRPGREAVTLGPLPEPTIGVGRVTEYHHR